MTTNWYLEIAIETRALLENPDDAIQNTEILRPRTRRQWTKSTLFCLCYQINVTFNAWYCGDWQNKISELYMHLGETTYYQMLATSEILSEKVKFRSQINKLRSLFYKRVGNISGLSSWLINEFEKNDNEFISYIIEVDYNA